MGCFIDKNEFKNRKYLGSGGIRLFRDTLWAATGTKRNLRRMKPENVSELAKEIRAEAFEALGI